MKKNIKGVLIIKKLSIFLTVLILLVFSSIRENSKVSKVERLDYENFLKEHPFNNRPHMSKRDWKKKYAKKDRPDLAAEQNFLMTLDPATGQVPRERLIQVFEQAEISRLSRAVTVEINIKPRPLAGFFVCCMVVIGYLL